MLGDAPGDVLRTANVVAAVLLTTQYVDEEQGGGGGAGGIRTPYLFNAIEALSRVSYSPTTQKS